MPKEEKSYMPSGMGGLMRFGEEEEPLVKIEPKHVLYIIGAVVAVEIVLKFASRLI